MGCIKDYVGQRFGSLLVCSVEDFYYPLGKNGKTTQLLVCKCDCGATKSILAVRLTSGNTKSCGCLRKRITAEQGLSNRKYPKGLDKEVKAWHHMKDRVLNPSCNSYPMYCHLGIEEEWKHSFESFYNCIGKAPSDGNKYSVGRIDNFKGYFIGNVRWETAAQQSRNRGMLSNNTSGIAGVRFQGGKYPLWVAHWRDINGKTCSKAFSLSVFGEDAFELACSARSDAIALLNSQNAGYSGNHGLICPA